MARIKFVLQQIWNRKLMLALTGVFLLLIGEGWMRAPFLTPRLEYEADKELGGRLRPVQTGYIWLAKQSLQSPPVSIDGDGLRGDGVDWDRPAVICVGDSDGAGMGVRDDEVWTHIVQMSLKGTDLDVQVVNACHPGHGPYHHAIRLERLLQKQNPRAVGGRVTMNDRGFAPLTEVQQEHRLAASERSRKIRSMTKFAPYLVNKLLAQIPSMKQGLKPWWLFSAKPRVRGIDVKEAATRFWDRDAVYWQKMIDLRGDANWPILFLLHAPYERESDLELERLLRELITTGPDLHLLVLRPGDFGLDADDSLSARKEQFR
ncbi:MAG: hypothetical protein L7S64_07680, partial [Longimicrobiales bacterium]|nr:hypothetical protein [Longimicrobiales bacterium]